MTKYLLAILLIVFAGYGFIEARPLILGPALTLTSPRAHSVVEDGFLTVRGSVARTSALTLNGAPLIPEANGNFATTLTLPKGGTFITLTAQDRFGRSVTRVRDVFVP